MTPIKITVDSDGFQTPRNPQQKFFTVTLTRYVSIINNTFDLSRGVLRHTPVGTFFAISTPDYPSRV